MLYHLFELPELKDSRCILIGVANNIDLTVRLLPRLQARGWEPHMVTFPAYDAQELATLLEQVSGPPTPNPPPHLASPTLRTPGRSAGRVNKSSGLKHSTRSSSRSLNMVSTWSGWGHKRKSHHKH